MQGIYLLQRYMEDSSFQGKFVFWPYYNYYAQGSLIWYPGTIVGLSS